MDDGKNSEATKESEDRASEQERLPDVEQQAIGRIDDQLYFIATRHKETLWDFADALREYGFIDAIYITGGADFVF